MSKLSVSELTGLSTRLNISDLVIPIVPGLNSNFIFNLEFDSIALTAALV